MGHPAILDKLREHLEPKRELREPDVVYLMVGIRKLMEVEKIISTDQYRNLKFHCDWALHTALTKSGAKAVIQLFDELEDMRRPDGGATSAQGNKMSEAMGVDKLRMELTTFLGERNLPTLIADDEGQWNSFLKVYGGIIEDVPLILRSSESVRHISQVVVSRKTEPEADQLGVDRFLFALEWHPTRADSQDVPRYRINFNSLPEPTPALEG
ncbi:MAG: hypothetical protein ABIR70_13300 [Bryobacteraceae bacterium]